MAGRERRELLQHYLLVPRAAHCDGVLLLPPGLLLGLRRPANRALRLPEKGKCPVFPQRRIAREGAQLIQGQRGTAGQLRHPSRMLPLVASQNRSRTGDERERERSAPAPPSTRRAQRVGRRALAGGAIIC